MSTFFGFSDECGMYRQVRNDKFLNAHPYYLRSTLLISANEWRDMNYKFQEIKKSFSIPLSKEVKWAYLWNLRKHQDNNKEISDKQEYKFLEHLGYEGVLDFISQALSIISTLDYKKIIITHTDNAICPSYTEKTSLTMHIQEHMQRIEMEMQVKKENLAVLFFDPVCQNTDRLLRNIYFDLFNTGDFIKKYNHIKDSLNIENSHQSVGIQIADYISGTFSCMLKGRKSENYLDGKNLFFDYVYPNLRRKKSGELFGFGLREIPSNSLHRQELIEDFDNILARRPAS